MFVSRMVYAACRQPFCLLFYLPPPPSPLECYLLMMLRLLKDTQTFGMDGWMDGCNKGEESRRESIRMLDSEWETCAAIMFHLIRTWPISSYDTYTKEREKERETDRQGQRGR